MRNNKSLVFISPDYHCSFMYRKELRAMGWETDIFVPCGYPNKLLYSKAELLQPPMRNKGSLLRKGLYRLTRLAYFFLKILRYKYHFYYGELDQFPVWGDKVIPGKRVLQPFRISLWASKFFGKKVIQLPSGCLEEETKANFSRLDGGNVCENCGWGPDVCNDERNVDRFDLVRRYADMMVGTGSHDSSQFKMTHFKYKSLDLNKWKPDLVVPKEHLLPKTSKLRILHLFYDKNRTNEDKNIKGTPYVVSAIERLRAEGHEVEYMYLSDIPSRNVRFYQIQADIVVEQLIYGWWGSNGVETMALGKPVVCYLRPSWKEFFFKTFPEYKALPIVEANTQNIYEVLKELVENKEYREKKGTESRDFAKQHFDVKKNAQGLISILEQL